MCMSTFIKLIKDLPPQETATNGWNRIPILVNASEQSAPKIHSQALAALYIGTDVDISQAITRLDPLDWIMYS